MGKGKGIKVEKEMSWDEYFMQIAKIAAAKSHCYSRKLGAVLVKGKTIISTGYNGPPMGVSHCEARHPEGKKECPRRYAGIPHGEGIERCPAGHAERNAIDLAAKNGISTEGTIIYCYCGIPCKECAISIINAGVKEVVCLSLEEYDRRPEAIKSKYLFDEAGVKIRVFGGKEEVHRMDPKQRRIINAIFKKLNQATDGFTRTGCVLLGTRRLIDHRPENIGETVLVYNPKHFKGFNVDPVPVLEEMRKKKYPIVKGYIGFDLMGDAIYYDNRN